ncbi:hypothetical protein BD560DRAFT_427714 [Blakeslea trispora]|nr:hypothetical protein BD560DRAFT_427714 [Blakeslea trispora]
MIYDKDNNKHITVNAGEINNKTPPSFSGTGELQDPLLFIEQFDRTAKWNNWRDDGRLKELFMLCLTGHAKRWAKNHITNDAEKFESMTFDGLLPHVRKFCEKTPKDPFNATSSNTLNTFEGLEKLIRWAESCLYEDRKLIATENVVDEEPAQVMAVRRTEGSEYDRGRTKEIGSRSNNNGATHMALSEFEKQVLSKLSKLDSIENDLALFKDRVDLMEKGRAGNSSYTNGNTSGTSTNAGSKSKCYNCEGYGHFARDCGFPCISCNSKEHSAKTCPRRSQQEKPMNLVMHQNFQDSPHRI